MTVFGITDKLHWLVRAGHAEAPVIFDDDYHPKPAYDSLLGELKSRELKVR
ncbi:MAG: endo-1,4-beta-xylanase [Thermoguttaceae bacterium]